MSEGNPIKNLVRSVVYATPLFRYFAPRYRSTYVPLHLCRLIDLLDQTAGVPGSIVEVGCWTGETTIWLNRHLKDRQIQKPYYAVNCSRGALREVPSLNYLHPAAVPAMPVRPYQ